ncbi:MAG: flavodoxin-dependent (E)-4-hydroxy-3-methylbut-2-enyl-diphosphate synthase [Clostridia bacterium]|nr:flavodoxin-dependent (E)-4-hydroxy-3-methylbut-2-enyl-diphosphate synthase [Clostridia bacterium]
MKQDAYNHNRRISRKVLVGGIYIGGDSPVSVQSMTNTDTKDSVATIGQIKSLEAVGCDIVRITVPDVESADTIKKIKASGVKIPIVADIHFDYKVALAAISAGVDKVRINPGNIGGDEKVREVALAASAAGVPIRIGVNGGSLEKEILGKYGSPTAEALAESALYHAELLRKHAFEDIVISIKSSSVKEMIGANRILAKDTEYPLHIGVTEAGRKGDGTLKSAIGIGSLLCDGIGDTVRVSLTADPVEEIYAAKDILKACGVLEKSGMTVVSCPTCGRTKIDLIGLAEKFEIAAKEAGIYDKTIKVAIMGCAVNGPGEAKEADIGIAGGSGEALLFKHGEIIRKIKEDAVIDTLIGEIKEMTADGE